MSDSIAQKTYGIFANPIARKIIAELENTNADVRLFPPVEIEKIVLRDEEIKMLGNLKDFDWLIFTDVLAVDFFLETLAENEIDLFELDDLRVCAVGETVADQLRFSSIHSDVIPANHRTENILSAIGDYVGTKNFENLRFLFPKANADFETLAENLRAKKAGVQELDVYAAHLANKSEIVRLKTLLTGGAIDEFIFTAPADFIALENFFKTTNFSIYLTEIRFSADSSLMQAARENNLSPVNLFHLAKN